MKIEIPCFNACNVGETRASIPSNLPAHVDLNVLYLGKKNETMSPNILIWNRVRRAGLHWRFNSSLR